MSGSGRVAIEHADRFGKVAVLMGGRSAEREISLMTGEAVHAALRRRGVDAHEIDPGEDIIQRLVSERFDRAWIALHGRGGEDGAIQGALDTAGIPYTGSGVLGSALCMDKLRSKKLFQAAGLSTPEFVVMTAAVDAESVIERLGLPVMVKPACEGSSVGMARVDSVAELVPAWQEAARYDTCVLAERWFEGSEYSAPVLQGAALPIVRIETPRTFYDYEAKYFSDETQYFCPCGLDAELERACQQSALAAFDVTSAGGWGRVDFMMGDDGKPSFLEVNTIPGMTSHSLVPMGAAQVGIDFDELVWRVLETSLQRGAMPDGA